MTTLAIQTKPTVRRVSLARLTRIELLKLTSTRLPYGLLAASLGLSRMYRDDLAQLDAAMGLYDAFYRWARDAVGETHNWPMPSAGR